jgi:hypothetical protein
VTRCAFSCHVYLTSYFGRHGRPSSKPPRSAAWTCGCWCPQKSMVAGWAAQAAHALLTGWVRYLPRMNLGPIDAWSIVGSANLDCQLHQIRELVLIARSRSTERYGLCFGLTRRGGRKSDPSRLASSRLGHAARVIGWTARASCYRRRLPRPTTDLRRGDGAPAVWAISPSPH